MDATRRTEKLQDFALKFLLPTVIILIVLAVYHQILKADFVMWDDDIIIYNNHRLGPLSPNRIRWAFTDVDSMMRYNPLTLISWSATISLFGLKPFGFHLGNWLFHGCSSVILYFLIRKIVTHAAASPTDASGPDQVRIGIVSFIATLLWALHPLRVEPVAWATDRTYCQALFFVLLSALCYVTAHEHGTRRGKYIQAMAMSFVFYVLSVFSYANGITFFVVYFILDIFLFKRIGGDKGWLRTQAARQVILEKLLFAVPAVSIGLISVIVRVHSAGVWKPPVPLSEFGLLDRFMQASYIVAYYAYRPFYPFDLAPVYSTLVYFDPLSVPFLARAAGVCAVLAFAVVYRRRCPLAMATLLSYCVLLVPVMGFFEHPHYHVDRYSLLPSIAFTVCAAFILLKIKSRPYFLTTASVSALIVLFLGVLSLKQTTTWHDSETLFTHMIETLKGDPYQSDIYWRLGKYLYEKGDKDKAIGCFENTLTIDPDNVAANAFIAKIRQENSAKKSWKN